MKTKFIIVLALGLQLLSAKTISIMGTADLQGMMKPSLQDIDLNGDGKKEKVEMGGIAHLATAYHQLKKENPNSFVVSAGDDLMNKFFHVYKGKAIFSLMSDAGYDLYALGNHEFDKGSDVLAKALDEASFTTICSDLNVSNSALKGKCTPYLIKEIDGVKVGFFTIMTENLLMVTSEKKVKFLSKNIETSEKMIKLLRAKGANVVVLISHIGYKNDIALAKQVKGIDLIFGGHSHHYVKKMGHIGKTSLVNGGEQGTFIVKVDIPLDDNLNVLHDQLKMTQIPVETQKYKANKEIDQKIDAYLKQFPKAIVLGETQSAWNLGSDAVRKNESTVVNLINDLMKEKFKVDIVLNNAGAFRGKQIYPKGNITDEMLKAIDEFSNYAIRFKLKGKHLKPILERSASQYGEGGLLHPSGLKYKIILAKTKQKLDNKKVIRKGERVENIEVYINDKWTKIEAEKTYNIASNAFIVENEGDGYFWFNQYGTDFENTFATFYSIMAETLEKKKVLSPQQKDARLEIIK
ncbi:MAG: 2',3'-cyclic-nucleotide 2'-phosphodiesterase (EC / 5'-nucleotidase (EC [uncultured Sulfurovum sp.]|uniref:2',3'-cyclic-nucleotide 2'-phosphodiesterase ) n=1 Tax=uncultured Sulfurovum sp. TaxID=269237 RepID=A0A6S6SRV0_9BACT|nr:MAG: 2',3'-cyclic-nucleotide 2'-phosphodiesterase (EC / 5'-nucleotidase (EC [uncultured Sulfurovum sp.]